MISYNGMITVSVLQHYDHCDFQSGTASQRLHCEHLVPPPTPHPSPTLPSSSQASAANATEANQSAMICQFSRQRFRWADNALLSTHTARRLSGPTFASHHTKKPSRVCSQGTLMTLSTAEGYKRVVIRREDEIELPCFPAPVCHNKEIKRALVNIAHRHFRNPAGGSHCEIVLQTAVSRRNRNYNVNCRKTDSQGNLSTNPNRRLFLTRRLSVSNYKSVSD